MFFFFLLIRRPPRSTRPDTPFPHPTLFRSGIEAPVYLVQSNGGVTTPAIAAEQPARLLLSGPSGGARAAEVLAAELGEPNLIAVDMGGTDRKSTRLNSSH